MTHRSLFLIILFALAALFGFACDDGGSDTTVDLDNITDTATADDGDAVVTDQTEAEATPDVDEPFVPKDCLPLTAADIVLNTALSKYTGTLSAPIGDAAMADALSIEFYLDETTLPSELTVGIYDLATPPNDNYATCAECVRILADYDTALKGYTRSFFQYDGTLEITETMQGSLRSKGSFSARLVEVSIESDTHLSTPIIDGPCYEVTGSWDTVCIPDCEGKSCGSNGCGGLCGDECGPGTQCNEDQSACVACTAVTLGDITASAEFPVMYTADLNETLGDETLADTLQLTFADGQTAGTVYDLSGTNYADCPACLLIIQDGGSDAQKTFFPDNGTLTLEDFTATDDGKVGTESKGTLENIRLIEVTIDASTYVSTPVVGGACLTITDAAWDTMPVIP